MPGTLLTEGTRTLGTAKMLAAELETSPVSATRLLQKHTGKALRTDITDCGSALLTDEQQHRLGAPGRVHGCFRTGYLRYDVHGIAAAITFTWLPGRLTVEACQDLAKTNRPAGLILSKYGVQRIDRRALVITEHDPVDGDGELDIAVKSSAVLVVGGLKAAIATERITRDFTSLIAERAAAYA